MHPPSLGPVTALDESTAVCRCLVYRDALDMPVVDMHTHVFPDWLAGDAVRRLEQSWGVLASFDGTAAGLHRHLERSDVSLAVVQPVATAPGQVRAINDWLVQLSYRRILPFAAMHPDVQDQAEEVSRIAAMGFRGFKLHPELQGFRPDSDFMRPLYEATIKYGLIIFSCAGPYTGHMTVQSTPNRFSRVIDEYPELSLVLAHMGGYQQWDEVWTQLVGRRVFLETSFTLRPDGGLTPREFSELVCAHGAHRVLFGTDAPLADIAGEIYAIRSLDLASSDKEQVLWRNAIRLLRLPRRIDEGLQGGWRRRRNGRSHGMLLGDRVPLGPFAGG